MGESNRLPLCSNVTMLTDLSDPRPHVNMAHFPLRVKQAGDFVFVFIRTVTDGAEMVD